MASTETKNSATEADAATLARIRQTIDELDAEMHRCLIERGTAIDTLIKVKGTSRPGAAFRPGREADMMRRLVARHEGALPIWTVEHIWREIITTFTRMQARFDVSIDQGVDRDALRDTARFLFGFTVALHGQDGFNADQARTFAPTPQPYQFGLCGAGVSGPICAIDPATAPKVMDTITPPGVDQRTELNPTLGPVQLHGVPVP